MLMKFADLPEVQNINFICLFSTFNSMPVGTIGDNIRS